MGVRLAIFGDFSGRLARGDLESGDALAARRPVKLDIDTLDEVIEGFAQDLVLPLAGDGTAIGVPLASLDDLHPDELYENVAIFAELSDLRRALRRGSVSPGTLDTLRKWGAEAEALPALSRPSQTAAVPSDRPLDDFAALIGAPAKAVASPLEDLIARVVGPYVVAAADPGAEALVDAVDQALSGAMNLVLHHPEVQAIEAAWRSLEFLARRIETGEGTSLVVYDVSAVELAADLAGAETIAQSGLYRLLTDARRDAEPFTALIGLYEFSQTPPHAELLARLGDLGARVSAPFVAAASPDALGDTQHPLAAEAWSALAAAPQAGWLGLAAPAMLLRRPYGKKSDPVDAFAYEEFNDRDGLASMLWGNPAVGVAVLIAENGGLGPRLTLPDMPYHIVQDRHGDQIALPATARAMTEARQARAAAQGIMALAAPRGTDTVRLSGLTALTGAALPLTATRRPAPPPAGAAPALNFSHRATRDDLEGIKATHARAAGTGVDDIDPDLAALLEDL